ncbi:MAG: DUF2127 domain-containing protein [Anaerolineaceae bacterium]|nr:DUF2127 domain-containing protein [Anaerolineaceae bacterium]
MPEKTKDNLDLEIEREIHVSWAVIAYKFLFGLFETISGFGILVWGGKAHDYFLRVIARELTEDPHDVLATLTFRVLPNLLAHHLYLAIYLILLGSAKVAGAIGLIKHKNWGVDLLVGLTIVMLPFQVINLLNHPDAIETLYFSVGLLIALYLINFRPREWVSRITDQVRRQMKKTN